MQLTFFLTMQNIDLAPGLYETQKYQTINAPTESVRLIHQLFLMHC